MSHRAWEARRVGGRVELTEYQPDGKQHTVTPAASQQVWNHSPDGFEFGYGGSGPSQLALAIMLRYFGEKEAALAVYQDFKFEFVATAAGEGFVATEAEVDGWVENLKGPSRDRLRKARAGEK